MTALTQSATGKPNTENRWWTYQHERFSLVAYGALALAVASMAIGYSMLLRGAPGLPAWTTLLAASVSALAMFATMRAADEFKDRDDDARWRPYRPVPRGLVTLRELGRIVAGAAVLQLAVAASFGLTTVLTLLLMWGWFALMSKEFFAPGWLKARPLLYMLTHLPISGLIALHLSAFDWSQATGTQVIGLPPPGIGLLFAIAFGFGALLEIGRKLRAPQDEEPGVVTYTAVWGMRRALAAWFVTLVGLLGVATAVAARFGVIVPFAIGAGVALVIAILASYRYLRAPDKRNATFLDTFSRVVTLLGYGGLYPLALWLN